PHTAVGWLAAEETLADSPNAKDAIVLGTAHPAKFSDLVEPILGRPVELPERLARHLSKPVLSVKIQPELGALKRQLQR
ncbi:MAG: threonine synthase, partial [Acidobacteriota bacterium]